MNMTLKINGKEIVALDCENPNATLHISGYGRMELHWARHTGNGKFFLMVKELPPGTWSILGRAGSLTEEQARGLVEEEKAFKNKCNPCYKNYNVESGFGFSVCTTPLESWQSYCKANGIKENQLVLVKQ